MLTKPDTGHLRTTLLSQRFATATQDASEAMKTWTRGRIELSMDELREVPLDALSGELSFGDELLTMVVLTLDGPLGGQLILSFDDANGREFAATLLQRPMEEAPEWSALEQSALQETGNILGCAYLRSLAKGIGTPLIPSPPWFIQDFGASVLEHAVLAQAMASDHALICKTNFHCGHVLLNWHVFFVPSHELLAVLESVCTVPG